MKRTLLLTVFAACLVVAFAGTQAASSQVKPPPPSPTASTGGQELRIPNGIFLCYSEWQTIPGIWDEDTAVELLTAGYWYPEALPGNVDGGTNLGSFHLQCNASGTPTGMFVNENGMVVTPEIADNTLGYYPEFMP